MLLPLLIPHLWVEFVFAIRNAFYTLISKQTNVRIVALACECLCLLAKGKESVRRFVCTVTARYGEYLRTQWRDRQRGGVLEASANRVLFVLGCLCRHAGALLSGDGVGDGLRSYVELLIEIYDSAHDSKSSRGFGESID